MGLSPPRAKGSVRLEGEELLGRPSYRIARAGIGYVPAGPTAVPVPDGRRAPQDLGRAQRERTAGRASASTSCSRGWPSARRNGGAQLSGGEQQMLAIGRALARQPQAPHHGRAVRRARADGHRGDDRDARAASRTRDSPSSSSSRTSASRPRSPSGSSSWSAASSPHETTATRSSRATPSCSAATSASSRSRTRPPACDACSHLLPRRALLLCGASLLRRAAGREPAAGPRLREHAGRRLRDLRDERRRQPAEAADEDRRGHDLARGHLLPDRIPPGRRTARHIAFSSKRIGTFDIYVMRADGSGTQTADVDEGGRQHPTWSPDGEAHRVRARRRHLRHGRRRLRAARALGRRRRRGRPRLVAERRVDRLRPPAARDVEREIWIMRPDGSGAAPLTPLHGRASIPRGRRTARGSCSLRTSSGRSYDLYVGRSPARAACVVSTASDPTRSSPPGHRTARPSRSRRTARSVTVDLEGEDDALTSTRTTTRRRPGIRSRVPAAG